MNEMKMINVNIHTCKCMHMYMYKRYLELSKHLKHQTLKHFEKYFFLFPRVIFPLFS